MNLTCWLLYEGYSWAIGASSVGHHFVWAMSAMKVNEKLFSRIKEKSISKVYFDKNRGIIFNEHAMIFSYVYLKLIISSYWFYLLNISIALSIISKEVKPRIDN